jgi:hypothetical protein
MSNNTGGAAFPCEYFDKQLERPRLVMGMTLRDYFAAKALPVTIQEMNEAESYDLNDAAIMAYHYADAMLRAREA